MSVQICCLFFVGYFFSMGLFEYLTYFGYLPLIRYKLTIAYLIDQLSIPLLQFDFHNKWLSSEEVSEGNDLVGYVGFCFSLEL